MKIIKNDEAVSPVIGVILMVAITVILAAVIAAFVFGMAGTSSTTKNVGITAAINSTSDFRATIQGGTDLNTLTQLKYAIGSANTSPVNFGGSPYNVGSTYSLPATSTNNTRLVITGTFQDGSSQVLYDRQY